MCQRCLTSAIHCEDQKHKDEEEEENEAPDKRFSVGNSLDPRVLCAEELMLSCSSGKSCSQPAVIEFLTWTQIEDHFRCVYTMESELFESLAARSQKSILQIMLNIDLFLSLSLFI